MKSITQINDEYNETGRPIKVRACEVVGYLPKEW
jgi:hypothetical protein